MAASVRPSANDIHELLAERIAFVSGGEVNGRPIISIPQDSISVLLRLEHTKLINLFLFLLFRSSCGKEIPQYTVVANLRSADWADVKPFLKVLELTLPPGADGVYLITPSAKLSLAKYSAKSKLDNWKFKVIECGMKALLQSIPASQLTKELRGNLVYNHEHWVDLQLRADIVRTNCDVGLKNLSSVRNHLQTLVLPSSSAQTHALTESTETKVSDAKAAADEAIQSSANLLSALQKVPCKWQLSTDTVQFRTLCSTLYDQMAKVSSMCKEVDKLWMDVANELRMACESQSICEKLKPLAETLTTHRMKLRSLESSVGDSVTSANQLKGEHATFAETVTEDLQAASSAVTKGKESQASGRWKAQVDELVLECDGECTKLISELTQRSELLDQSLELHNMLEQGESLCEQGFHQLAVQSVDVCLSEDGALQSVSELEGLKGKLISIDVQEMETISGKMSPSLPVVQRVKSFVGRQQSLIKILAQRVEGIQTMSMKHFALKEQLQQHAEHDSIGSSSLDLDADNSTLSSISPTTEEAGPTSLGPRKMGRAMSLTWVQDDEADPKILEKRKYIAAELVNTERVYIEDLRAILDVYWPAMEPGNDKVPPFLVGKQNILFGNIPRIFDFHEKVFLPVLESCQNNPVTLGFSFLKQQRYFQMYVGYCKNKPRSEALLKECNPTFFEEIRQAHGFRLSVETYLIKPVQRITKYHLLLKDLMKNCQKSPKGHEALQGALTSMLSILEHVNNIMHSIGIIGFPGSLLEQGRLLLQDTFQVLKGSSGGRLKRLKLGAEHSRQVFLYEHAVIISKRKDQTGGDRQTMYIYKDMIKVAELALTENAKDDQTRFQMAHFKHDKVYTLQARNVDVKQAWVAKIRQLLEEQLTSIQNLRKREEGLMTLDNRSSKGDPRKSQGLSMDVAAGNLLQVTGVTPDGNGSINSTGSTGHSDPEESSGEEESTEQRESLSQLEELHLCEAVSDFDSEQSNHLSLKCGDRVQVLELGQLATGWCRVKSIALATEGWVPSSFLRQVTEI